MKKTNLIGAMLTLSFAAASFIAPAYADTKADKAYGIWDRTKNGWQVEFKACADNPELLCGEIISGEGTDKKTGESVVGIQMLYNLQRHRKKPNVWKGKMYNPGDGGTYAGSVTVLNDNKIKMAGCMMKVMCRSEKWPRAAPPPAPVEAVVETPVEAMADAPVEAVVEMATDAVDTAVEAAEDMVTGE